MSITEELLVMVPLRGTSKERVADLSDDFKEKLVSALSEMPDDLRVKLAIGSARRYTEEQREKYQRYLRGGPLAAKPGTSRHEFGEAIDFWPLTGKSYHRSNWKFRQALTWLYINGPRFGIEGLSTRHPVTGAKQHNPRDLVHFQLIREDIEDWQPEPAPTMKRRPRGFFSWIRGWFK